MIEYYVIKSQIHNPDTPTYMEALSGENAEKMIQGNGLQNSESYEKGQMRDCFKEVRYL